MLLKVAQMEKWNEKHGLGQHQIFSCNLNLEGTDR